MQQVIQNIRSGELTVQALPEPLAGPGEVLIANMASTVSAGTEKYIRELAKKSLIGKARARPDQVRRVLQKIGQEGLMTTIRQVQAKLSEPMTMGYSSAGLVLAVGEGVDRYRPGDRVASNGPHAGVVAVPMNLCARVPENVPFDHAAFAVIGSIGMQGVRLARVSLGETVLVIGLGLIGLMAVQMLRAAGVNVIGTDLDEERCRLAERFGALHARPNLSAGIVEDATDGVGADAVLITAATSSNGPIELAAESVRQKGRIVLIGVVGLDIPRKPMYLKEAEFVVSCSYGPGRYAPDYEQRGHDYPPGHVRWTEQRNIQAVLDLMGGGGIDIEPLITHRFPIDDATKAYEMIESGSEPFLGVVLNYPPVESRESKRTIELRPDAVKSDRVGIGLVGAGNFARMTMLPALQKSGAYDFTTICSAKGVSARSIGEQLGFTRVVTDESAVFEDSDIDAVFILTRHDLHARQVAAALRAGKHVFVEKPLAITTDELIDIDRAINETGGKRMLLVGFNRRFSKAARLVRAHFEDVRAPKTVSFRFNAGAIPADTWIQHPKEGGGRIIGEACHAIDLAAYLIGSPPVRVYAESIGGPHAPEITEDQSFITCRHGDGSISNIAYLAGGDRAMPKERIEVLGGGRMAVIDDFRTVHLARGGKVRHQKVDGKGHADEVADFARALREGGEWPIAWDHLKAVSLASILAVRSMHEGVMLSLVDECDGADDTAGGAP